MVRRCLRILFSTSVFQIASLALASRVKLALPETFVVIGVANVEGVMGLEAVRQFSFLDAAKCFAPATGCTARTNAQFTEAQ